MCKPLAVWGEKNENLLQSSTLRFRASVHENNSPQRMKCKPQNERNYLQCTHLTTYWYYMYAENSYKLKRKQQRYQ
jgi:hypothetical protein